MDFMHIEKNVCENLLGTLLSLEKKNYDTDKARFDWNEVTPQMLGNILSALHSEYTFIYKDDETKELLPADCFRHQIDQTVIHNAKRMRRNQKSRLSGTFLGKCCGQKNVAKKEIPKGYQKDDWEKVIEEFATDDWKVGYNSKKLCYLL